MVGTGIRSSEVVERSISLPNLVVGERVSSNDVPSVLAYMDVLFCGLKPKNIYNYGVSLAKSYEYMAAAKPIIWMVQACNNPVSASGGGWTVQPENIDGLEKTIRQAFSMRKADLNALGAKGRKYLEKEHSYDVLGKRWEDLFRQTLAERST
jgi:glycosyltransferase involved in cell wall biosynthesis